MTYYTRLQQFQRQFYLFYSTKHHWKTLNVIVVRRGALLEFYTLIFIIYARRKGTGEPCPNFLWNFSKISPDRFEKFYGFCYPYVAPFHMVYEFWTGTPPFRLWHFWATVDSHELKQPNVLLHQESRQHIADKLMGNGIPNMKNSWSLMRMFISFCRCRIRHYHRRRTRGPCQYRTDSSPRS